MKLTPNEKRIFTALEHEPQEAREIILHKLIVGGGEDADDARRVAAIFKGEGRGASPENKAVNVAQAK